MSLRHDQARDAAAVVWVETIVRDVRYGLRQLFRSRGFSLVAVLSLALGIGANTAIFTLIDAVLLQNLPVKDPGKLVLFYDGVSDGVYSGGGFHGDIFSYASWEYFRDHNQSFENLCSFRQGDDTLALHIAGSAETGPREQVNGHLVSGSYFDVFGVKPAIGRLLTPADDAPDAASVAVISFPYWQKRFHSDPSVIGTQVDLNGAAFIIVGVTPQEFFGERVRRAPDFWLPLTRQPQVLQQGDWLNKRDTYWLNLLGRLRPGVTQLAAQATLNTQLQQFYLAQAGSHISPDTRRDIYKAHITLRPGGRGISWMRFLYSEPLHILMVIVALVLLIACANVATLLLARASARRNEFSTRLALGASRGRLIRQLLTESLLLSFGGGVIGAGLAWWGVKALALAMQLHSVAVQPDLLVLFFTLGVSIAAGLVFGLAPALRFSRWEAKNELAARPLKFGWSRVSPGQAFLVLQIVLSAILMVGAGLLTHSLFNLEEQNFGYKQENVLLMRTDPRLAGYQPSELPALYDELQERVNALPGVISASIARFSPLSGYSSSSNLSIEGYTPPPGKEMDVFHLPIGPRFFETLGVPLMLGRTIGPRDTAAWPLVAVVNETFVHDYFAKQNPIGKHFSLGSPFKPPGAEIVGVVADSKFYSPNEKPKPMAFFSVFQPGNREPYSGELLIRTMNDPSGAAAEVREAVHGIDSRLPVEKVTTLKAQVDDSLRQEKVITSFTGFFALLALALVAIGLYGSVAYSVAQRTNEIGVHMALGAQRRDVLWLALREATLLLAVGLGVGVPTAAALVRLLQRFLYGLPKIDPVGLGAAIVVMIASAALASFLPAARATKIDPMAALRHE